MTEKKRKTTTNKVSNKIVSVLLVDDHPVIREGYRRLLENTSEIRVIAEASSGEMCYLLYQEHKPDVVVLDLNMPGIGGLDTIRRIKTLDQAAHILVFTMHNSESLLNHALNAGALGFISKQCGIEKMVEAIYQVSQGKIFADLAQTPDVDDDQLSKRTSDGPLSVLTPRERQIFYLLADGKSCAEIAGLIAISPRTVGVHHTHIMRKLNAKNRAQLTHLATNNLINN